MTKHLNKIAVSLDDGDLIYFCSLQKEFQKDKVMKDIEKKGQYVHKNKYHIPALTAQLIKINTRGIMLSTVLCPHCKKYVVMTINSIMREDMPWCCNCHGFLYDAKNKNKLRNRW